MRQHVQEKETRWNFGHGGGVAGHRIDVHGRAVADLQEPRFSADPEVAVAGSRHGDPLHGSGLAQVQFLPCHRLARRLLGLRVEHERRPFLANLVGEIATYSVPHPRTLPRSRTVADRVCTIAAVVRGLSVRLLVLPPQSRSWSRASF
jgi:hypothetical protein